MKARYFCDVCGREVLSGTARCPGCGRFFSAVKCPRCAFQGDAELFESGCPVCGWLSAPEPGRRKRKASPRKRAAGSSLTLRAFRRLTALLVVLMIVFLILLLFQPFNR